MVPTRHCCPGRKTNEKGDEIYDGRWKNRQFDGLELIIEILARGLFRPVDKNKPHGQGEWIFRGWDDTGSGYGLAETAGRGKNGKIEPLTLGHDGRSRLGDRRNCYKLIIQLSRASWKIHRGLGMY